MIKISVVIKICATARVFDLMMCLLVRQALPLLLLMHFTGEHATSLVRYTCRRGASEE